jgi:acetyl esterase/lipase
VQRDIVYGQADGVDLKLDLARPAEGGPFPAVVCIHGGAWQSGAKSGYAAVIYMLAQKGYAAATVEYRFAPKYRYPAQIDDVRRAVRYLRARAAELKIDPTRMAALGDSAGGQLALLLGVQDAKGESRAGSSQMQAVVNLSGPSDMTRWRADPVGETALKQTSDELLERVFGTANRKAALIRAASPLRHVDKKDAPVLTFHGDADTVVKPEQSEWLHHALAKAKVEQKLVLLKGAGHGFRPEDMKTIVATTLEFLDAHLKKGDN